MSENVSYRSKVDAPALTIRMDYRAGNNLLLNIKRSLKIGGVVAAAVVLMYGVSMAATLTLVALVA